MKIAVIGMGLIGGSFHKAAAKAGHEVAGFGRGDAPQVDDSDLVIIAVPPSAVAGIVDRIAPNLKDGAVVVDATGVKGAICKALHKYAFETRWTFVGGHPMAGKEVSGLANADADLFRGASMILVPSPATGRGPLDMLEKFFHEIGFARVVFTTPERHDEMIAYTSQLAHVISSAYVREPLAKDHLGFSAGSFKDMIRVGAPAPKMWTELFLANRDALLPVLDRYIGRLAEFRAAIAANDSAAIMRQLEEGVTAKAAVAAAERGRRLVVATHNKNKVREIGEILPDWTIVPEDSGAEETAETFAGNALLKARALAPRHPGAWVMADDSGLEVDALGGAPGVRSARYAGRDGDTPANNALLLKNLVGVEDRRAHFTCAIALVAPDGSEHVVEGCCQGRIQDAPSGAGGFGYDPLFVPDGHKRSFAELSPDEKNAISHRGRALAEARKLLEGQA